MRRGTTPTFAFEVDLDLSGWDVYVTFEQYDLEITRKNPEIEPIENGCICSIELTQAETLSFKRGKAQAQLRAVDQAGTSVATEVFDFEVGEILLDNEIPQEV